MDTTAISISEPVASGVLLKQRLMREACDPALVRFERWAYRHARLYSGLRVGLPIFVCFLIALTPTLAFGLFDFTGAIKDLFAGATSILLNMSLDAITSAIDSESLTASFNGLLGDYSSVSITGICSNVANAVILPCARTVLTLTVLMQLVKIAGEMDRNGGTLPAVREIVKLFVILAIFLYLVNNGFEIMKGIFELVNRILGAISTHLYADEFSDLAFETEDLKKIDDVGILFFMMIIALVIMLLSLITVVIANYMFLARAFEIYLLSMFAPMPFAFLGLDETKGWAIGYLKNFIQVCLSGAIMLIVLFMIPALVNVAIQGASNEFESTIGFDNILWIVKLGAVELLAAFMLIKSGSLAGKILGSA